jgi:hypothetical protein
MRSIATGTALFIITLAAASAASAQDDFHWSGHVDAGDRVEVIGISADIDAQSAGGSSVEVTATGLHDGAHIEVQQHADGITFCVVHAGLHRTGDRCNQEGNGEHHYRWHDEDVRVQVRVPSGVRFTASTVSGDVDVEGLTADVQAHSVSGDVQVSTRGSVEAGSVSGDLQLTMGRLPARGSLEFRTVSGDVDITLPRDANAELRASTLSGDIDSEFRLEVSGRNHGRGFRVEVGQRAHGTLGHGGAQLDVETVSGDITVRKG